MPSQAWEHLQSVVMQVHNRRVAEEFNDLEDDDDISTPRSSLRTACKMVDSDSADMTLIRYFLFYFDIRKAKDLQADIYGIPITSFQEIRRFKPQIQLYFQEDLDDIEHGFSPVTAEISFRLMNETAETLTHANLETFGNRVREHFASGGGYTWWKGKTMCTYIDKKKGYQLQLLCRNKSDGRGVVERVLSIQSDTPDWKYFKTSENEEPLAAYPTLPPHETILGRSRRLPRERPVARVRFISATLHVWGLPNPITLIDRSHTRRDPVIVVH